MTSTAPVDLGDLDATRAWVDAAAASHGGIDVLFNNASSPRVGPFAEMTADDWHYTIRNELHLVYYATAAAWPPDRARRRVGRTASIAATRGRLLPAGGARSRQGRRARVHVSRRRGGAPHRIRANAILPGMIRTPSTEFLFETEDSPGSTLAAANPLGRVGEAEDVAKLAAFLASDDAWYINAAAIPVDGGQAAIT